MFREPQLCTLTTKTYSPAVGAVYTPVLGLYPFPVFWMTTSNTKVPLFQEQLEDDTKAVIPIFWIHLQSLFIFNMHLMHLFAINKLVYLTE